MIAEVTYLQRHKVERILKKGAAFVTVYTEWCEGLPAGLPQVVNLRVGRDILPRMELELTDDALAASMTFGGVLHSVLVPWCAVLRSELQGPPSAPSGAPLQAVA